MINSEAQKCSVNIRKKKKRKQVQRLRKFKAEDRIRRKASHQNKTERKQLKFALKNNLTNKFFEKFQFEIDS